ncbi:MAG: nucleotidyl transferase AbiEii/AbiGii toxin family protein [Candidatus Paracaedibacteraceae bacterium]|nr:nucleotidyl transferase AbiEii/AbiGii toxin family protein [Candidatus Paracaedibacteraceae bacterium]
MDDFGEFLMKSTLLRREIKNLRKMTGISWEIIEQDYVLSWMLYGISKVDKLKTTMIFKGGTALKKCYFGDYRFSQDLDFSVQGDYPRQEELLDLIIKACKVSEIESGNIDFTCNRYPERDVHPEKQEAFVVHARLPWQRDYNTSVKIEVTTQESVLLPPEDRRVIHGYHEELDCQISTYQIEEIISEKIRAILQFAKKLHERGWGRSRVRDYYDLWRIFSEYSHTIKKEILPDLVQKKCYSKSIIFESIEDLFQEKLLKSLEEWDMWLAPIVPNLPDSDQVIKELRIQLQSIF